MSKLKIGLVLDDSLDSTDGVQQYVLTVGRWLESQGHEVHYLVGATTRTNLQHLHSLSRNLRVRFNGNTLSIPLPAPKNRLQKLLDDEQFNILHVQAPYSPFLAGKLIRYAAPRTAIIGSFHVMPYNRMVTVANKMLAILNRRTAKRFSVMLANSAPAGKFANTVYGFSVSPLPNPFPLNDFKIASKPATDETITIVFLGRLVERKGALQLLQAVSLLRDQNVATVKFKVIIGGKGGLLAELQEYGKQHAIDDLVSFEGFISEADKADFLAQADIAVFPSISGESFGISLLEAMEAARGVVLGGDNPGYRSVLGPLAENQLVMPNNTQQFADKLAYWINNETAREQAAKAQKQYVKQYDITVVGKQLVQIYSTIHESSLRNTRDV